MPELIVVAGPNGSGKSTLVRALGLATIDPDRIAYEQFGSFSPQANLRSSRQALTLVQQALARRDDLAQETTLAGRQPLRLMQEARALGYRVTLLFVTSDDDTRLRIDNRVLQGGHNITDVDLERRYPRVLAHLPEAIERADASVVYSSSEASADFRLAALAHGRSLVLGEALPRDIANALVTLSASGWSIRPSESELVAMAPRLVATSALVHLRLPTTS